MQSCRLVDAAVSILDRLCEHHDLPELCTTNIHLLLLRPTNTRRSDGHPAPAVLRVLREETGEDGCGRQLIYRPQPRAHYRAVGDTQQSTVVCAVSPNHTSTVFLFVFKQLSTSCNAHTIESIASCVEHAGRQHNRR